MSTTQSSDKTMHSSIGINFYPLNIEFSDDITVKWENRIVYSSAPYSLKNIMDKITEVYESTTQSKPIYGPIAIKFYPFYIEFYDNITVKWENQIIYKSAPSSLIYSSMSVIDKITAYGLINLGPICMVRFAYGAVRAIPPGDVLFGTVLCTTFAMVILNGLLILSAIYKTLDDLNKGFPTEGK